MSAEQCGEWAQREALWNSLPHFEAARRWAKR